MYEESESALKEKLSEIINEFKPEIGAIVRKLERILIKLYWQHVSIWFNQACLNEGMLHTHKHTHTHTHIYIYIYMHTKIQSLRKFIHV